MGYSALYSRTKLPSLLAVDLALARLNLAAIRAKKGIKPNRDEITAAELLVDYFSKTMTAITKGDESIEPGSILAPEAKDALRRTLSSLPKSRGTFDKVKPEIMQSLITLLKHFIDAQQLESHAAETLLGHLKNIKEEESEPQIPSPIRDIARYMLRA